MNSRNQNDQSAVHLTPKSGRAALHLENLKGQKLLKQQKLRRRTNNSFKITFYSKMKIKFENIKNSTFIYYYLPKDTIIVVQQKRINLNEKKQKDQFLFILILIFLKEFNFSKPIDELHQSCHTFCFRLLCKFSRKIPLRWVTVAAAGCCCGGFYRSDVSSARVNLVTRFCGGPVVSGFALNGEKVAV